MEKECEPISVAFIAFIVAFLTKQKILAYKLLQMQHRGVLVVKNCTLRTLENSSDNFDIKSEASDLISYLKKTIQKVFKQTE